MTEKPKIGQPKWERALRLHLATLCMAATAGEKGDMRLATDEIVEWVADHAQAIASWR